MGLSKNILYGLFIDRAVFCKYLNGDTSYGFQKY